jgi:hypothetical protein
VGSLRGIKNDGLKSAAARGFLCHLLSQFAINFDSYDPPAFRIAFDIFV